jgi:DNA-binding transcriptional ArsR family regulator
MFVADLRSQLACLGHPSRFRIARSLLRRPVCVSDLAAKVGLSQSCTTRHLQALDHAGLVRRERTGKKVVYHLRLEESQIGRILLQAFAGRARGKTGVAEGAAVVAAADSAGAETIHDGAEPQPKNSPEEADQSPQPAARHDDMEDYLL